MRHIYWKLIAKTRWLSFQQFCTQGKPWGKVFTALKKKNNTSIPLLEKEDGSMCNTKEESIEALLSTKFPRTTPTRD